MIPVHICPGFGCAFCRYFSVRESNKKIQELRALRGESDAMIQAERSGVERTVHAPDHTSAERSRRHG